MTESDWQRSTDPEQMLTALAALVRKLSERKLRLLGCAYCRRAWRLLSDTGRTAIEDVEQYADNPAGPTARLARDQWWERHLRGRRLGLGPHDMAHPMLLPSADFSHEVVLRVARLVRTRAASVLKEMAFQCVLIRDVFGNPFVPLIVDPAWRTDTVISLARAIYDERAFDRMPILGDALEEAGCDSVEILRHCRAASEHVRGCWVLDWILERT